MFLGQNDLCMSMGLFGGKYDFPEMYTSPELAAATDKLIANVREPDKTQAIRRLLAIDPQEDF